MKTRPRVRQTMVLEDRLAQQAQRLRAEAAALPPGPAREEALHKAKQAEAAARLSGWLSSPGLQRPT